MPQPADRGGTPGPRMQEASARKEALHFSRQAGILVPEIIGNFFPSFLPLLILHNDCGQPVDTHADNRQ
jgi:hypothetical protein